jgi:hypothetical protein
MWMRTHITGALPAIGEPDWQGEPARSPRELAAGLGLGATGGAAAAFFGVGMAPFLQLGLLTVHHLPLRQTVGTTMLVLVFISASGGIAMARHGDVSTPHLIGLTIGLGSGAYFGARFTRRAPRGLLRATVVVIPFVAGAMLLFL